MKEFSISTFAKLSRVSLFKNRSFYSPRVQFRKCRVNSWWDGPKSGFVILVLPVMFIFCSDIRFSSVLLFHKFYIFTLSVELLFGKLFVRFFPVLVKFIFFFGILNVLVSLFESDIIITDVKSRIRIWIRIFMIKIWLQTSFFGLSFNIS